MLKALLLLLMNLALAAMAMAQNLVLNPSFEDTTLCDVYDAIRTPAIRWYNANTATPDIWDCDTVRRCGNYIMDPTDSGVQFQGYKYAFDGDRFAAGYQWYGPNGSNTRDYFTSKLATPLTSGMSYVVTLWCARPSGMNGAIDHIGVYFGPDSLHEPYPTTIHLTPQVQLRDPNSTYISDTSWVQLTDTFLASGGEEWVIVGTFLDANDVDGISLSGGSQQPTTYYYIDLLSVEPLIGQAVAGVSRDQNSLKMEGSFMVWYGETDADDLVLFDATGKVVWRWRDAIVPQGRYSIPEALALGPYVACAFVNGQRYVVRFVK